MATHTPIPDAALEADIAILGKKGRGKTYTAKGCVERLLDMGRRVIVLDPLSTWWGLKAGSNGYPIAVLGGPHADLQISDKDGAALGRYLAGANQSAVIDLGAMRKAELVRFATAFLEELYTANRDPLWLVLEEADVFAPQNPMADTTRLLGEVDRIARRGRQFGFRLISLTQRPAKLNKDVLTQLSTLIALGITSPQDRDAIKAWVEGNADRDKAKQVVESLASLRVGEGWIWAPDLDLLERVKFPPIKTMDTSATPKAGETRPEASIRQSVDVEALKAALALPGKDGSAPVPAVDQIMAAEQRGYERGYREGFDAGDIEGRAFAARVARENFDGWMQAIREGAEGHSAFLADLAKAVPAGAVQASPRHRPDMPRSMAEPVKRAADPRPKCEAPTRTLQEERPLGAERRPLSVLAGAYPAGMTEAQWAVAAGLKRTGGTWATYLSRLRTAGRIERDGDVWRATETGLADLGEAPPAMPAPGPELVEFWAQRIAGAGPMLRHLARIYPRWITRDELAAALDLSASGGTFSTYISRLRSPGLIEVEGGRLRAAESLMKPVR